MIRPRRLGQNYRLVNRYDPPVADGPGAPERIIAPTFTRKAAGEFEGILNDWRSRW